MRCNSCCRQRATINGICFRRWCENGTWEAAAMTLADAMADNRHHSIDSTTVRGHVSAAGAKDPMRRRTPRPARV
jgi:hypothetical protein